MKLVNCVNPIQDTRPTQDLYHLHKTFTTFTRPSQDLHKTYTRPLPPSQDLHKTFTRPSQDLRHLHKTFTRPSPPSQDLHKTFATFTRPSPPSQDLYHLHSHHLHCSFQEMFRLQLFAAISTTYIAFFRADFLYQRYNIH